MATATTTVRTLQASASNSAGGTTTGTGFDNRTSFGGLVMARITNGGTGPTVGCDIFIEVSRDNSEWRTLFKGTALVTASNVDDFPVRIEPGIQYVRSRFTGNTGQAVTVEAYYHEVTSITT
jgi:hypothetical protein